MNDYANRGPLLDTKTKSDLRDEIAAWRRRTALLFVVAALGWLAFGFVVAMK